MKTRPDFRYTYREVVRELLDGPDTGFYSLGHEVVLTRVDRMLERGWAAEKIIQKGIELAPWDTGILAVSLAQIVYHDHPVLAQLDDVDVRIALYLMGTSQHAKETARLFRLRLKPESGYQWEPSPTKQRIKSWEGFIKKLSQ